MLKLTQTSEICRMCRLFFFLFLLWMGLPAARAEAGIYYVSPTGSAPWTLSLCENTPCSAATAMKNAVAGDTVYFLSGRYNLVDNATDYKTPALNPNRSGTVTQPIVFRSLHPLGANFHGLGGSPTACTSTLIGANSRDHIVWEGFLLTAVDWSGTKSIYATARFQNAEGCAIKNCKLAGGIHHQGGATNKAGVFFEHARDLLIENNVFHGYLEADDNENNGAVFGYDSDHIYIKNNEIHGSTIGIRLKDNVDDSVVSYNYIYENHRGIYISNTNTDGACERNILHDNLISNNRYVGVDVPSNGIYRANDLVIHNNTIWGNNVVGVSLGQTDRGHYPVFYNNILKGSEQTLNVKGADNCLAACDHNLWAGPFRITTHQYEENETAYTTLGSWQVSRALEGGRNPGQGALERVPLVENWSGLFEHPSDFQLSPGSPGRRAGRDGEDMGADVLAVGVQKN